MGPQDSYLIQYSRDTDIFWAEEGALELGACFSATGVLPKQRLPQVASSDHGLCMANIDNVGPEPLAIPLQNDFDAAVQHGFQASQTWHQGVLFSLIGVIYSAAYASLRGDA